MAAALKAPGWLKPALKLLPRDGLLSPEDQRELQFFWLEYEAAVGIRCQLYEQLSGQTLDESDGEEPMLRAIQRAKPVRSALAGMRSQRHVVVLFAWYGEHRPTAPGLATYGEWARVVKHTDEAHGFAGLDGTDVRTALEKRSKDAPSVSALKLASHQLLRHACDDYRAARAMVRR